MHVAFHTRGHGVDHWVFEPSFPSFLGDALLASGSISSYGSR